MPGGTTTTGMTTAQLQALKANIAANTSTVLINSVATQIKDVPVSPDNGTQVADWYNLKASPDFNVFRSNIPADDISNQITWSNYTPSTAIADAGTNAAYWTACSMANQGKQFNLQLLLPPGTLFNAGLIAKRAGLNDATTNLLKADGVGGKASGGWSTILPILVRLASNVEKLFAVATTGVGTGTGGLGTTGNPGLLVLDSTLITLTGSDVINAWNS